MKKIWSVFFKMINETVLMFFQWFSYKEYFCNISEKLKYLKIYEMFWNKKFKSSNIDSSVD